MPTDTTAAALQNRPASRAAPSWSAQRLAWTPREWRDIVGVSKSTVDRLIAAGIEAGGVDSILIGTARRITTSPEKYIENLRAQQRRGTKPQPIRDASGDEFAAAILRALRARPDGLSRSQIFKQHAHDRSPAEVGAALARLAERGVADVRTQRGSGRPASVWSALD